MGHADVSPIRRLDVVMVELRALMSTTREEAILLAVSTGANRFARLNACCQAHAYLKAAWEVALLARTELIEMVDIFGQTDQPNKENQDG